MILCTYIHSREICVCIKHLCSEIFCVYELSKKRPMCEYFLPLSHILIGFNYYNIIQVKNDGVYIAQCRVSRSTTTKHAFVYDSNHTTFRCDIEDIYCGSSVHNQKDFPNRIP